MPIYLVHTALFFTPIFFQNCSPSLESNHWQNISSKAEGKKIIDDFSPPELDPDPKPEPPKNNAKITDQVQIASYFKIIFKIWFPKFQRHYIL